LLVISILTEDYLQGFDVKFSSYRFAAARATSVIFSVPLLDNKTTPTLGGRLRSPLEGGGLTIKLGKHLTQLIVVIGNEGLLRRQPV